VLLFTLVVSSTLGLFYYLRILVAMYSQPGSTEVEGEASTLSLSLPAILALGALSGVIVLLGVYPAPLWGVILAVTRDLG
jgi:NADH-quinone oxidoreductase subunit N